MFTGLIFIMYFLFIGLSDIITGVTCFLYPLSSWLLVTGAAEHQSCARICIRFCNYNTLNPHCHAANEYVHGVNGAGEHMRQSQVR